MIVPGRGQRHCLAQPAEPVGRGLHRVRIAQLAQVLRLDVAVNVVAEEHEEVEVVVEDGVEDRLRQVLLQTGTDADPLERRLGRSSRGLFFRRATRQSQQRGRQQRFNPRLHGTHSRS